MYLNSLLGNLRIFVFGVQRIIGVMLKQSGYFGLNEQRKVENMFGKVVVQVECEVLR